MIYSKKNCDTKQRFSIRKLTVGTCSVLLSTLFLTINNNQIVHAADNTDTTSSTEKDTTSANQVLQKKEVTLDSSKDAQDTQNPKSKTTDNAKVDTNDSNNTPTKANTNNDANTDLAKENTASQTNPKNKQEVDSAKVDSTKSTTTKTDAIRVSQEETVASQKDTKTISSSDNIQSKAAENTENETSNKNSTNDLDLKASTANSKELTKNLKESKIATELPAPELNSAFAQDEYKGFVVQGSNMNEIASQFLTNSDAITKAGGKITWDGPNSVTNSDVNAGTQLSGNIVVSYPDSTKKTVTAYFMGVAQVAANANLNTSQKQTGFLYVSKVGDSIDVTALDANNTAIFNSSASNSIIPTTDSVGVNLSAKLLGSPNTSTIGFHELEVEVTDSGNANGMTVIGSPYTVKVPYLVQTLEPITDTPIMNIQKSQNVNLAGTSEVNFKWPWLNAGYYDSLSGSGSGIGRFFYKDYLKYFALGGNLYVSTTMNGFGTVDNPISEFKIQLATSTADPQILSNAPALTVKINWLDGPKNTTVYTFKDSTQTNLMLIKQAIKKQLENMSSSEIGKTFSKIALANGSTTQATAIAFSNTAITNPMALIVGTPATGKYTTELNISYGQGGDTANGFIPDIFSTESVLPNADLLSLLQKYNPKLSLTDYAWGNAGGNSYSPTTWTKVPAEIYSVNVPEAINKEVNIADGPQSFTADELQGQYLKQLTFGTTNATSADWPAGTTFEFVGGDAENGKITMDAPGQTKTTQLKITLPGGSTTTVNVTLTTAALQENQREVKVRYLDSDDNDKLVSTGDGFKIGEVGSSVNFTLSIPDKYELKPGQNDINGNTLTYKITDDKSEDGIQYANVYLIHKTEKITDPSQAEIQETRTATVNYVYGTDVKDEAGNIIHAKDSQAAPSAVLDVFYTRTAIKDLVTGNITYGNWQWDDSKNDDGYTNGYKVVSGTWSSLPTSWAPVVADVPTVDGFTAWTKISQTSVPTNQFVFPTYVNQGTSQADGNSTAYTSDADTYEARPVHTVWYLPIETEARTVTENYHYWKDGQDAGEAAPSSQVQVFYSKNATNYDATTGNVTYGAWKFDKSKGDSTTPGFHVISGNWNGLTGGSFDVTIPQIPEYTSVTLNNTTTNTSTTFGTPTYGDTQFTSNTGTWYYRNSLTTYYVPTAELNKTVIRTIKITNPSGGSTLVKQSVIFTKTPRLNADDNGVVFGAQNPGNAYSFEEGDNLWWNNTANVQSNDGNWDSYPIPVIKGYTAIANNEVTNEIASKEITVNSSDEVVNVIYVANSADVTIDHSEINQVYTGEGAVIPDDITHAITPADIHITIPDAVKNVVFDTNDYSFANAEGKIIATPVNVGTYHIILNQNGLDKLKAAAPDFTFTYDPKTSYVVYNITPVQTSATLSGTEEITYDNQDVTSISSSDIKITIQATPALTYNLQSGDYQFVQNGQVVIPKDVGTYEVQLTQTGIDHLTALGGDNYNWFTNGKANITQNAKLVINKATPTVTINGSASKTYDGLPINNYAPKVTISAPGVGTTTLTTGDFEFNVNGSWTETAPVNAGNYQIRLTKNGLNKIISQNANNIAWANNYDINGEYTIVPASVNITLHGNNSKTYDGKEVIPSLTIGENGNTTLTGVPEDGVNVDLNNLPIDAFEWQNSEGQVLTKNPVNAGVYTLTLTDAALTALAKNNPNYTFTKMGSYTYTINKAQAVINTTGKQEMSWTGNPVAIDPSKFSQSISTDNDLSIDIPSSVKLTAEDYDLVNAQGNKIAIPTAVGHYYVKLNENGLKKIQDAISNNSNYNWKSNGEGDYIINKAQATITLEGTSSVIYNGSQAIIPINEDGTVKDIRLILSNGETYNLKPSDLKFMDSKHIDAGSYKLQLSDAGLANIRAIAADRYEYTYDDSQATLIINKAAANYTLSGSESKTYKGSSYNDNDLIPGNYKITITTNNGQTMNYTLKKGDLTFAPNQDVLNKGIYKVVLTEQGINNIQALNPNNYDWKELDSAASFEVTAKNMFVNITGTTNSVYEHEANNWAAGIAQGVPSDQIDKLSMIWAGQNTIPDGVTALKLNDSDFVYYQKDSSGNWVKITDNNGLPVHAGTYGIKLTEDAINKLNEQNKDSNYTFANGKNVIATFIINARKAKLTLSGYQSAPYTTNKPLDYKNFTLQLTDTDSGTPYSISWDSVKGDENDYLVITGYENGNLPKNVGSYDVKVTPALVKELEGLFPDYNFGGINVDSQDNIKSNDQDSSDVVVPQNNNGKYIITPLDADIELTGSQTIKYGEDATIIPSKFTISLKDSLGHDVINRDGSKATIELTTDDLQIITPVTNNPMHVGTYKVLLTDAAKQKIFGIGVEGNSSNYEWSKVVATDATFVVDAMPVNIDVTNANENSPASVVFGNPISLDNNLGKYTISLTTENGKKLEYTLQKGDLEFTNGIPTTAGVFDVKLSAQGLENLKQKFNKNYPNYDFDKLASTATFLVKAATPQVTITANSQEQKTYNGQAAEIKAGDYTVTFTSNAGEITIGNLDGSSLQFEGGVAPTAVGNYNVILTDKAIEKLKADYPNFDWSKADTFVGTYKIVAANAEAVLSGQNSMTYNGQAVTVADLNKNGTIHVTVSIDGMTKVIDYQIQDNDYVWSKGETPRNVGVYTLELNKKQVLTHLQEAINASEGLGQNNQANVTISLDDLSGNAEFTINKRVAQVVLDGTQTSIYTGNIISIDPSKFTLQLDNGETYKLQAGDLQYTDDTAGANTNVGTWQVVLTKQAEEAISKLNQNYDYKFSGVGKVNIDQADVTKDEVSFSYTGNAEKTYDGTPIANYKPTITITAPGADQITLEASDYKFIRQDGTVFDSAPWSAGKYKVVLTEAGIAKIKAVNNKNLNWSKFDFDNAIGRYIINKTSAKAVLSGNASLTYNGNPITSQELNNKGIQVKISIKRGDKIQTIDYWLHNDDYTWETPNGAAPSNVGVYTIVLNKDKILPNLIEKINRDSDLVGNYELTEENLSGSAQVTIEPKDLSLVQKGEASQTFNGKNNLLATTIIKSMVADGIVNGQVLNIQGISLSDFDWYENGQKLDKMPINVGTYTLKLNQKGLDLLRANHNPNYKIGSMPTGEFTYTITPFEITITTHGNTTVDSGTTTIPNDVYSLDFGNQKMPADFVAPKVTASDFGFSGDAPTAQTISGEFSVNFKGGQEALQKLLGNNYNVVYTPAKDNYIVKAAVPTQGKQTIQYVNSDGKIIKEQVITGKLHEETTFNAQIPTNWQLANGEKLPDKIKIENGITKVIITPQLEETTDYKTVTRTIIMKLPTGDKEVTQVVKLQRTGSKNLVTGKVTYSNWSTSKWDEFIPEKVEGYTANPVKVNEQAVTSDTQDISITINYIKNGNSDNDESGNDNNPHPEPQPNPDEKPDDNHQIPLPNPDQKPDNNNQTPQPDNKPIPKPTPKPEPNNSHSSEHSKSKNPEKASNKTKESKTSLKEKVANVHFAKKPQIHVNEKHIAKMNQNAGIHPAKINVQRDKQLPQTGENNNSLLAAIGSLFGGLGIFGLAGNRKKKREDK
ncbi:MBG domain-containing protein [Lactobacillus sp. LL6]|uniref:MBG domain-containing protein n=1 Tax=Lactobacillus sp. LL6 TaxID=2596827 RepID=UPI001642B37A|nr:MBG domain-containing protein [Lactobacillus sp. LL6]